MDVAITLRKISADCIKTVRSVTESEEEAVDLVMNIWSATASQVAHSLRVGKSTSLMPLGVLYLNALSADKEPALAVSELFIMQFGISVKPSDQGSSPGPSTKPAYTDIASAVHVADKAIIPNVITAVVHRLGEMCAQHPRVRVDFAPLGEIRCEQQRLEFVAMSKTAAVPPQTTEPKRTVRAILARRRREPEAEVDACDSPRGSGVVGAGVVTPGREVSKDLLSPSVRSTTTTQPASVVAGMVEKRLEVAQPPEGGQPPAQQYGISPRQHKNSLMTPRSGHRMLASSSGQAPRPAQLESSAILSTQFTRALPPRLMQFPPLLDEFSRTLAAPYGEELFGGSNSGRIASHFSPLAGMLVWSNEGKCLKWRIPTTVESKGGGPSQDLATADVMEKEFENQKILNGSPLDLELREAKISRRVFYGSLSRYRYYVSEGIKDSVVAPINQAWVENVGYLVEADHFCNELEAEQADAILSDVHAEMLEGYLCASKKAIADYIFKDPHSRERALVSLVPAPVPEWGSVPFVGIEGTVGGPPDEWREGIEQNRDAIVRTLTACNQSSLRLLNLWNGTGYAEMLLVDLPPPAAPLIDIDRFFDKQKARCQMIERKFKEQWLEEVCAILREENLHLGSITEGRFFKSIATLLSVQMRSAVAQSADALVKFLSRFGNANPLPPEDVVALNDTDEREDAFLTIKVTPRGEEIRLKDSPEKVSERCLKIFRDFIVCLNDIPLPETRLQRVSAANKDKCLWGTSLEEQHVQQAEKVVDKVVNANMANVERCLHLYDEFTHLLSEDERIKEFIKDQSNTSEDYLAKFNMLVATEKAIREKLPSEIRMQMASVDCAEVNQILRDKAGECIHILLDNIVTVNFERNEKLDKSFHNIVVTLSKKPAGAGELVDLEQTLEQFRATTMKELLDEFSDIRAWLQLLFDCKHQLQPKDFKAITESAGWVHKIDGIMNSSESFLRNERDAIEGKFKQDRQKFEEDLVGSVTVVNKFKDAGNLKQMEEYLERILALKENFERAKFEAEKFREKEVLLGWDTSEFEKLHEGIEKLQPYDDLWELVYKFSNEEKKWMRGPLFSIDPEVVDQAANTMAKRALKLQSLFESMSLPTPAGVAKKIKKDLDGFKQHLPLVHALCNPGLRQRHWDEISEVVGFAMERDQAFTLSRVIDMDVGKHMAELREISDAAGREYGLETTLNTMVKQWEPVNFELKPWKDTETYIVNSSTVDEMQSLMDDHIIKAQTMKGSPFAKPFMEKIVDMESWLVSTQEIMDMWIKVQGVWLYLEPIFGSEDIVKQMPTEAALFKKVDAAWRTTMATAKEEVSAKVVTRSAGLLQRLKECNENLEHVQKGLNDYLETKRLAFPRFFFLSNDNLLEILSETKDPTRVNPHMKKAFEGIQSLEFQADNKITAIVSSEKERVPVVTIVDPAKARGNVELWLVEVEATMLETVRHVSLQASDDYTARNNFTDWLKMWPGQVVIAIFSLYWTLDVGHSLHTEGNTGVQKYGEKMENQLIDIIELVRNDVPALVRCTLESLIVIFVHNKDTVLDLAERGIESDDDFDWLVQLRYYIEENPDKPDQQDLFVRITNSFLSYAYEYIGNSSRLVITPLTDRCYRTCCGALHLLYGAAPEGPAGTGKTESVKALGGCLGRQVLVFNCDEGIDFQAMGRIFIGLVRCGAWGCFDEFNRLLEEQMSAISQSVQLIQAAIKTKAKTVGLLGRDVAVNHNAGIFITLNPATKGYGGRQKLPDNLKQLFRPVAMSVPDNELIAEVMMFSEGFMSAKILAQKVVSLFLLSRQLLSSQQHYDWGLRALKPILTLAGRLLQEGKHGITEALTDIEESVILLKAVRMNTLSKLTFADSRRFQDLCLDLFPGVNVKDIEYKELEAVVRETIREMKLNEIDSEISKMMQFHEACQQRMGVGIVGPSGCGKSTIWKVLEAAYKKQNKRYVVHVMNPKSMPRVRLLGHMDHDTREWFDGVLTASARKVIKESVTTHNWIVCDGDIDPEWVESLNSVLDDNRLLTMPNGERIQFGTNVNFIFETDNLRFASPATISRLTMIFLSEEDVDVKPLINSWIMKQPSDLHAKLEGWFDEIFYKALDWIYKANRPLAIETTRMGMVRNVLGHMVITSDPEAAAEDGPPTIAKGQFLLAVCRGLGGNLAEDLRVDLAREVFKWSGDTLPDPSKPLNCQFYDGALCCYNPSSFETDVSLEAVERADFLPPLIPTLSVLRDMDLFRTWLADEQPIIVCGPAGSGKNMLIHHAIRRLQTESDVALNIASLHCNAQTSSRDVLQKLRQFCAVSTGTNGRIYRPREGRRVVMYMKDINLPTPDKYDTSEIIMFLQQVVMHNGFYDDDLEFVKLEHVQIVASMAPASTLGRHRLATRFTANVRVCCISYPSTDEIQSIYTQIVSTALTSSNFQNVADRAHSLSGKVAEAMVDVYVNVKNKFTVDLQEHYLFSPRDLTQWILQLLRYEVESADAFLEAWAHEANRIFRDRIVGSDGQAHFDSLLKNAMVQFFNSDIDVEKLCYTSLLTFSDDGVPRGTLKRIATADYQKMVADGLKSYQREVKDLPIELFQEVMDQLAWIDRALSAPNKNDMLIVGRAGVGRRSLVSLMSHMERLSVFSPSPARKYGDKEWKRDLKQVMQMTGVEKQHTVFFLEDHHLLKGEFLESINSLLSAGDVPGIWTPEELEPLLAPLKEEWAASQGRGGTARTAFEYFVMQVKERLRIVLSMDAAHPHFLKYCAANPALFTCTTVVWLEEWSQQSKAFIAAKQLGDMLDPKKSHLTPLLMSVHEGQTSSGASPRHFMTLLQTCKTIYNMKIESQSGQSSHLQKGLQKLHEVSQTVEALQADAGEKQKVLEEKQKLAAEALQRITAAMQQAAERRQEVEQLEKDAQRDQDHNSGEKELIEKELAEIQPILESAKKAVGSIKSDHLNEIRALKMPPEPIHDVLNGVLRLMGNYDNSWASMKKFLAGSGAIQRIMNFDPRQINESVRHDVEKLLKEKANSFDHATIYRVSVAAAPLARWVNACVKYSAVLVKVSPMEKKLQEATESLKEVQARLVECREQLGGIDQRVAQLREEFETRTREAEVLRVDLERANNTLGKANNLMSKMSGEKQRWEQQVKEIKRDADLLSTYTVLASAYCTYLGYFSEDIRQRANTQWTSQRGIESFDFLRIMSTESELLTWKAQGLSADRLSQENAVMIKCGTMVPFIVDPNSQAIEWLKLYLPNADTVLQQDPKLLSQLELAVRFGKVVIVQEVDGIEPFLFPLLRRDLSRQGPRQVVQLGEKMCDYNEGFCLYLCTRNSNAIDSLPPNAACLVTQVNFSVSRAGLEGQLLGTTLQHEKPELEQRKSELLQKEEDFKVQLAELEKKLLEQLADASGNILENEPLIKSLEGAKAAATTITESLVESNRLQVDLDQQREVYRPLATLGSRIFILIRELSNMDHMYRFSLEAFLVLFGKVLNLEMSTDSIDEKLRQLGNQLKIIVLFYISRSLFKQDRLAFGMHMVRGIIPEKFEPNEWELFQGTFVPASEAPSSAPSWCPPDRAAALQILRAAFPRVDDVWQLTKDALWTTWVGSDKCEESFDGSVYSRMSSFQRVLLIQAVRPDRLESALTQFACEAMGVSSLSPPPLSLARLHGDAEAKVPILFITTPGADPSLEIEDFAKQFAADSYPSMSFHQLAMGGGQNDNALKLLQDAAKAGDWVCLKNLHLVISWVPLLEKEIKSLEPHDNFRCWLTTESHAKFPSILLESSLKITYEAPPGVKKNLLRTLESWNQTWFGAGPEIRSQVIFICAHFHAIMQERRTYIPQGWTKFYEFSQSDLQSACETVSLLVDLPESRASGSPSVDWTTLIGVLEFAVYGSRVDNEFDSRLVRQYLALFLRSDILDGPRRKGTSGLEIPPFDIPATTNMSDFRARVEQLPDLDNPQSFGMAPNADRSLQRINSARVVSTLRQLASGVGEGSGAGAGSVDVKCWKDQLSPLWKLWDNVSKSQLAKLKSVEVRAVQHDDSPVVAFVLMDAAEATRLGEKVSTSLSNLHKVVDGAGLSTPDIQAEAQCLLRSEVPVKWTTSWPSAPEAPPIYLQGLGKRIVALKGDWTKRVSSSRMFEKPVALSDFLRPDVFLNALRQQTARKLSSSIDSLHLVASFEPQLLADPSTSPFPVTLQDLILEGCSFDESRKILIESARTSPLTSILPPLTIAWMSRTTHPEQAVSTARHATSVAMPIYAMLNRERLISEVYIHTDASRQRILNSAALFLSDHD